MCISIIHTLTGRKESISGSNNYQPIHTHKAKCYNQQHRKGPLPQRPTKCVSLATLQKLKINQKANP